MNQYLCGFLKHPCCANGTIGEAADVLENMGLERLREVIDYTVGKIGEVYDEIHTELTGLIPVNGGETPVSEILAKPSPVERVTVAVFKHPLTHLQRESLKTAHLVICDVPDAAPSPEWRIVRDDTGGIPKYHLSDDGLLMRVHKTVQDIRHNRPVAGHRRILLTQNEMSLLDDGQGWYKPGDECWLGGYVDEDGNGVLDLCVNGKTEDNWTSGSDLPETIRLRFLGIDPPDWAPRRTN